MTRCQDGHGSPVPLQSIRRRGGSALTCVSANSTSRAGSPLLFGLAPRGVFRASGVATGAVGSYPTFSPLPNEAAVRRRPGAFGSEDATVRLRRRSILCGTFRELL